jgi:hypothetical protein
MNRHKKEMHSILTMVIFELGHGKVHMHVLLQI